MHVVMSNDALSGARQAVDPSAVAGWELRGWTVVGPAAAEGDTRTVAEAQTAAETAAEREKALAAGDPAAPAKKPEPVMKAAPVPQPAAVPVSVPEPTDEEGASA